VPNSSFIYSFMGGALHMLFRPADVSIGLQVYCLHCE